MIKKGIIELILYLIKHRIINFFFKLIYQSFIKLI